MIVRQAPQLVECFGRGRVGQFRLRLAHERRVRFVMSLRAHHDRFTRLKDLRPHHQFSDADDHTRREQ